MKNIKYILILPILLLFGLGLKAQNFDFGDEKVHFFTDRTLFVCGEDINFFAIIENLDNQSKVLYIELILPEGNSLVSQKYSVISNQTVGILEIPINLISGTYYLKAYTKYMRNFGASYFTYHPIKIVNPKSDEFFGGNDQVVFDTLLADKILIKHAQKNELEQYKIQFNNAELSNFYKIAISIVPANSFQISNFLINKNIVNAEKYYPETRGISLSGQLIDSTSKHALAYKEITLSIIDQKNFIPQRSGTDGKFNFSLPEITGNHDVFISTKKEKEIRPIILVDKDFDSEQFKLPNPPFILSDAEQKILLKFAQNQQIEEIYYNKNTEHKLDTFLIPFYGKATNILYLDKYVKMETLGEYFTELPGLVRIKSQNGGKFFDISSPLQDMKVYSPLVLIDWVAVEDVNRILAVSPTGIEKVEVIPFPYVYGSNIYGGIISIRTRNEDFGGISLPKTGLFFNFDFFQEKTNLEYCSDSNHTLDTRNTLYWNTLTLEKDSNYDIIFKTKSSNEEYWIVIQGFTENGEIVKQVYSLLFEENNN